MKKTILTMAIIFASLLSSNLYAQEPTTCVSGQQTETCSKRQKHHHLKNAKHKMRRAGGITTIFNSLNGIELTDSQKVQIYDLREKYSTNPPSTTENKQFCQTLIDEIKTILNTEQVKQFESNLETNKSKINKRRQNMRQEQCRLNQNCQQGDSTICVRKK